MMRYLFCLVGSVPSLPAFVNFLRLGKIKMRCTLRRLVSRFADGAKPPPLSPAFSSYMSDRQTSPAVQMRDPHAEERGEGRRLSSSSDHHQLLPQRSHQAAKRMPVSLAARDDMIRQGVSPDGLAMTTGHHASPFAETLITASKVYHPVTSEHFGTRVDDFVQQLYPSWDRQLVYQLVQGGHIYRYRHNGKRTYTRVTDRVQLNELVVVPTEEAWRRQLNRPSGMEILGPDGAPIATADGADDANNGLAANSGKRRVPLSTATREEAMRWTLFKNEHVVVINKPSGVPMTRNAGRAGAYGTMNIADRLGNSRNLGPPYPSTVWTRKPAAC